MNDDSITSAASEVQARATNGAPVEVIKADIERTQAELADTLEALQHKLHPRRLIGNARGAARTYASRWAREAADASAHGIAVGSVHARRAAEQVRHEIEARPAAAVILGSGIASLAWLWLTRGPGRTRPSDHARRTARV